MRRRIAFVAGLLLALLAALLAPASVVSAHTGLDASTPPAGATVDGPLDEVVLDFTGTPTAIDDGVVVADATGARYVPADVTQDGLRITAQFDPPLPEGSYTLTWQVRSDDTHVVDGSFSFGVIVTAPTEPATTPPPTGADTEASAETTTPAEDASPPPEPTAEPEADEPVGGDEAATAVLPPPPPPPPANLAAAAEDGESTARLGRMLMFPSAVVAIGLLAFAVRAFAGRGDDLGTLLRLVRWLGVGVALGAVVELVGMETSFGGLDEVLGDTAGRAALARVVGGVLLVTGFAAVVTATGGGSRRRSLSAAVRLDHTEDGAEGHADPDHGRSPSDDDTAWRPGARDVPGLLGAALVLVSFAFDGHTLSEGPRALHAFASVTHVAAASVWAGGLVAFAVVLWRRHRDGVASGALHLTLRFSVMAMVSLAVAGVAGVAMALFIDSDLAGYVSTDWGRLLLVKLALVGTAAAIGAYNHFRVLPALEATPDAPAVLVRARTTVTTEAALLVGAAAVSGLLVAASIL